MMMDKSEIFNFECLPLFGLITVSNQNILTSLLSTYKFLVGCWLDMNMVILLEKDFKSFPKLNVRPVSDKGLLAALLCTHIQPIYTGPKSVIVATQSHHMKSLPQVFLFPVRSHRVKTSSLCHYIFVITRLQCAFTGTRHLLNVTGNLSVWLVVDSELAVVSDFFVAGLQIIIFNAHPHSTGRRPDTNNVILQIYFEGLSLFLFITVSSK